MSRTGSRSLKGLFPFSLLDPLAHPGGVHSGIDDEMSDVDILGLEFPRDTLGCQPRASRISHWRKLRTRCRHAG